MAVYQGTTPLPFSDPSVPLPRERGLFCNRTLEAIAQYKLFLVKGEKDPEQAFYIRIAQQQIEKLSKPLLPR